MSEIRGIAETLKLLDTLRETIHEFAAREEKLNAEFRSRSAVEKKSYEGAVAAQAEQSTESLAKAEADFKSHRERCQARYEQRKSKISRGHMASRARALERIKEQEGRRKYKVQEGTINAERRREKGLAEVAAAYQQFSQDLAETQQTIVALELKAQRSFNGYGALRKVMSSNSGLAESGGSADELQLLAQLRELEAKVRGELDRFGHLWLAQFFRFFPIWLSVILLLLASVCLVPALHGFGGIDFPWQQTGIGLAVAAVVFIVGRLAGVAQAKPAAIAIANDLSSARRLEAACEERGKLHHQSEQERIKKEHVDSTRALDQDWKRAVKESIDMLDLRPRKIDEQAMRLTQKNEQLYRAMLKQLENEQPVTMASLQKENDSRSARLTEGHTAKTAELHAEFESRWRDLETEWKRRIGPIHESIRAANDEANKLFPEWKSHEFQNWNPPQQFANAAKFGRLDVDIKESVESIPKDQRLAYPDSGNLSLPLLLTYPTEGSILLETSNGGGGEDAVAAINNIIYRLLATTPPGKLSFTIFDPVGLGQNFAGIMHLADYEESNINSRIWTQTTQLEEKLAELNEHMEKVIQMYLRNEYATIAEYNAQAGTIAEKYHFLVVADFPVNFSDTAARRLINIATSGARCGVYTLIHWDRRHAIPQGFVADELRKSSVCLVRTETGFKLEPRHPEGARIALDPPPSPELATDFLRRVGEQSKDSNRVEVPFEQVAPPPAEVWTEETADELTVPIGRSGATKLQYLAIGKGTRQHALIAGKTGSGKSTLFHVIVTNLALWCSPEQVEFYLVDFKKGVEFKCYATRRLPHARVVAIESDRQFGLSVLERVDAELRRRGDLFRQVGVQDLSGYKRAGGKEAMPRSLLIIDEFQEFFTEEDRVSQGAAVLLDRIVRQGRAFGIHVLLGSQTLGGAYTLARATIGQMVIRIALQCNEADAYLIMDQDNPAPRLLSRPGEGIYNDAAGAIEGNSPFQAVWLPEEVRDEHLARVRERADECANKYPGPFVFEGNAPADVRDNALLRAAFQRPSVAPPAQSRMWLGAPNSVKGPTEVVFQRQSGNNMLVVGQSEEPSLTIVAVALISLAAQFPKGAVRFFVLDSTPPVIPQREFLERVIRAISHEVVQVKAGEVAEVMSALSADLKNRTSEEQSGAAPETFVLIHGLQNYKKLKQEDEFGFSSGGGEAANPAAALQSLISDGPAHGIHVIATCDTYNNVNRFLGRKALTEFEMRVLFQMSASDSASLIDEPDASTLGLHRALYYNDREGCLETFRPYSLPDNEWVDRVARELSQG